jgi:plasmid stabilization system protein ParE
MAEKRVSVELTDSFLERLKSIESFLAEAGAPTAFYDLLVALREQVIPNLRRFPQIGRRYLDRPLQSVEALNQFARLPAEAADGLREYLTGDYLILYTRAGMKVYLLSIRHHRQLSFDFGKLWPGGKQA